MTPPNSLSRDEHTLLMLILKNLAFEMRYGIIVDRSYFFSLVNERMLASDSCPMATKTDAQSYSFGNPLLQVAKLPFFVALHAHWVAPANVYAQAECTRIIFAFDNYIAKLESEAKHEDYSKRI